MRLAQVDREVLGGAVPPTLLGVPTAPAVLPGTPRSPVTAVSPTDGESEAALVLCPLEGKEKAGP